MNDPFRNYDAWLTTDRTADAYESAHELMLDEWTQAVNDHGLPVDADEEDHPQHDIFVKWLAFRNAVVSYHERLNEEMMAESFEQELIWRQEDEQAYLDGMEE